MKKKKTNPWTIVGITIAIILLIYWLLAATILEEDENVIPILDGILLYLFIFEYLHLFS